MAIGAYEKCKQYIQSHSEQEFISSSKKRKVYCNTRIDFPLQKKEKSILVLQFQEKPDPVLRRFVKN